ncbi:hypothetical protein CCR96_22585 [Halochromatium roseum]|nr:hypothetical protein [Halochromatium roseum]
MAGLILLLATAGSGRAAPLATDCRSVTWEAVNYSVCYADPARDRIMLFNQDPHGVPYGGFDRLVAQLRTERLMLVFAVNGGMYDHALAPVGLAVENGVQLKAANTNTGFGNFHLLPNGVFAVGDRQAVVRETKAYLQSRFPADFATQSGPMLVIDGQLHPRFLPRSDSLKIRNGVGITDTGQVVFALSEQRVRFYDFARFFRDGLGCDNALYLDGSVSSLYAQGLGRNDHRHPLGPILGVVRPLPD